MKDVGMPHAFPCARVLSVCGDAMSHRLFEIVFGASVSLCLRGTSPTSGKIPKHCLHFTVIGVGVQHSTNALGKIAASRFSFSV